MNESEISLGSALTAIRNGDIRRRIVMDPETGDFKVVESDTPDSQDVTNFAEEGFA